MRDSCTKVNALRTIGIVAAPRFLSLPDRTDKPRRHGITHVLDKGLPLLATRDLLETAGPYVDVWKFGWGTAMLDPGLERKLELLGPHEVLACLGGTLLEVAFSQGAVDAAVELKVPDRDYAVELGLEMLLDGEWGHATLRAFHDVSNTHEGYEISADYSYRWVRGRFSIAPSVGVAYKSAELSDYYWGVHADEVLPTLQGYQVDGGIGWEAGLRTSYYVTKSMRVAVSANYEKLTDNIALSPLVAEPYVIGYFAGLAWQF